MSIPTIAQNVRSQRRPPKTLHEQRPLRTNETAATRIPANSVVWLLRKVRFNAVRSQLKAPSYTLVLGLTERIVHLLNVGVLFTAYAANIQRTSEVLVGPVLFCGGFRTLLDRGYRFDNIYSFLLPKLGAARLQDRRRYDFLLIRAAAQKGLRDRLAGSNPS